jgi:hypothetical protein
MKPSPPVISVFLPLNCWAKSVETDKVIVFRNGVRADNDDHHWFAAWHVLFF